jgi:hypothetical protein
MARYTKTIGELNEEYNIFDFPYTQPIGITVEKLQKAFVDFYAYREIAYETYEQWKLKFIILWEEMVKKYNPLFIKVVDIYNNYKSNSSSQSESQGNNISKNKHMPTPVSNQVVDDFIPSSFTIGEGESVGVATVTNTNTQQTKSDVVLMREYITNFQSVLLQFLKEFNTLMFKRY